MIYVLPNRHILFLYAHHLYLYMFPDVQRSKSTWQVVFAREMSGGGGGNMVAGSAPGGTMVNKVQY